MKNNNTTCVTTHSPLIYQKIADIMNEIKPIAKDNTNQQQRFKFRGIDDIYNNLHPLFAKHQVFISATARDVSTEIKQSKSGFDLYYTTLFVDYKLYTTDGSCVDGTVCGLAMDTGDKAVNKCMSYALRYFLTQMFLIPTGEIDPDADSYETVTKPIPQSQQSQVPQPTQVSQPIQAQPVQPTPQPTEQKQYGPQKAIPLSDKQAAWLNRLCNQKFLNPNAVAITFGFKTSNQITRDKFEEIINYLKAYMPDPQQTKTQNAAKNNARAEAAKNNARAEVDAHSYTTTKQSSIYTDGPVEASYEDVPF